MKTQAQPRFTGQLFKQWILVLLIPMAAGCVSGGPSPLDAQKVKQVNKGSDPLMTKRVAEESAKLANAQSDLRQQVEKLQPRPALKPVEPRFDPLDAVNMSLEMGNADARNIFQVIAKQTGLGLILPPSLSEEPRTLTISMNNMPASHVFRHVLNALDMNGRIENNLIIIKEYEEVSMNLDFLYTTTSADFAAGGDVFGENAAGGADASNKGSSNASNGLQSTFKINGKNNNNVDAYEQVERMLATVVGPLSSTNTEVPLARSKDGKVFAVQKGRDQPGYVLNRSTGTLFVRARPSQVAAITSLIAKYKDVMSRQVLIEAQIIDVELNDAFRFGVDWTILRKKTAAHYGQGGMVLDKITSTLPGSGMTDRGLVIPGSLLGNVTSNSLAAAWAGSNGSVAVEMLREFGQVHVLSNPSLRVKNTQPAIVSVGSNERYIQQTTSNISNSGGGQVSTSANVVTGNLFDGVVMGVIPYVDDKGSISLIINPMQTQVQPGSMALVDVGSEDNPMKISLPKIDFKGLTTSLNLNNGDMVIVGGLISETGNNSKHGLPGLADIPLVGALFGGNDRSSQARELVLVLRVNVL